MATAIASAAAWEDLRSTRRLVLDAASPSGLLPRTLGIDVARRTFARAWAFLFAAVDW